MLAGIDRVDPAKLKQIVEGALMAADEPLSVDRLVKLFRRGELDPAEGRQQIREALRELGEDATGRGYELKRVASGFRFQVRSELSEWIGRLWEEKPPRYSRALLETLALIAYKQPVTRGDIEQVRGVAVSQNIVRTLLERGWVRVVGQRETPGRPNLYGTTRAFLDYFNLQKLDELPPLEEIRSMIEPLAVEGDGEDAPASGEDAPASGEGVAASGEEQAEGPAGEPVLPEEQATGLEAAGVDADPDEPGKRLAEVVHLPTAGRTAETVREELHGE
ncbi:MAG: SMC-Scp complex subunit ScpB [Gammaproteobacteria bacterium]|nr:SMC-Scp complex subunit ScpB [Gammaproteobacteria bacterium]